MAEWENEHKKVDDTVWGRVGVDAWQAGRLYAWKVGQVWYWKRLDDGKHRGAWATFQGAARAAVEGKEQP